LGREAIQLRQNAPIEPSSDKLERKMRAQGYRASYASIINSPLRHARHRRSGSHRVMEKTRVLIVGAGPTGLVLALSLARRGVRYRIISDAEGPGEHSRAMAVQARTLEFYDQFGFADEVVRQGIPAD